MSQSTFVYAIISYSAYACFALSCYFIYKWKNGSAESQRLAAWANLTGLYIALIVMGAFEPKYLEAPAMLLIQNAYLMLQANAVAGEKASATSGSEQKSQT